MGRPQANTVGSCWLPITSLTLGPGPTYHTAAHCPGPPVAPRHGGVGPGPLASAHAPPHPSPLEQAPRLGLRRVFNKYGVSHGHQTVGREGTGPASPATPTTSAQSHLRPLPLRSLGRPELRDTRRPPAGPSCWAHDRVGPPSWTPGRCAGSRKPRVLGRGTAGTGPSAHPLQVL